MHWHAGDREIIVSDGMHAEHGEDATDIEQLSRRAETNGAVALDTKAVELVIARDVCARSGSFANFLAFTSATSSMRVPY